MYVKIVLVNNYLVSDIDVKKFGINYENYKVYNRLNEFLLFVFVRMFIWIYDF